jgi:hypothetical protein
MVYYAALPLVITPELLHFLVNEFLPGQVPWVAEADLLLSELCREIGYEQYAMTPSVRDYLVAGMAAEVGKDSQAKAARLLLRYLQYLTRTESAFSPRELEAQQWAAMLYLDDQRESAARMMASAFRDALVPGQVQMPGPIADKDALARLANIALALAPQLDHCPALVRYAGEVRDMLLGRPTRKRRPSKPESVESTIAGITLPSPKRVLSSRPSRRATGTKTSPDRKPATRPRAKAPDFAFRQFCMFKELRKSRRWYRWCIFVDGPEASLLEIKSIDYYLHSSYEEPVRKSSDRDHRFVLFSSGWGSFQVKIFLNLATSRRIPRTHRLVLKEDDWPRPPRFRDIADPNTARVYNLLFHEDYSWRQTATLVKATGLSAEEVADILGYLERANLVRRFPVDNKPRPEMWGATAVVGIAPRAAEDFDRPEAWERDAATVRAPVDGGRGDAGEPQVMTSRRRRGISDLESPHELQASVLSVEPLKAGEISGYLWGDSHYAEGKYDVLQRRVVEAAAQMPECAAAIRAARVQFPDFSSLSIADRQRPPFSEAVGILRADLAAGLPVTNVGEEEVHFELLPSKPRTFSDPRLVLSDVVAEYEVVIDGSAFGTLDPNTSWLMDVRISLSLRSLITGWMSMDTRALHLLRACLSFASYLEGPIAGIDFTIETRRARPFPTFIRPKMNITVGREKLAIRKLDTEAFAANWAVIQEAGERRVKQRLYPQCTIVVFSDPIGIKMKDYADEFRAIESAIMQATFRDKMKLVTSSPASRIGVMKVLEQEDPQIVHIRTHRANSDRYRLEEDLESIVKFLAEGHANQGPASEFARLCLFIGDYGESEMSAFRESVDCMITMREPMHDETATVFSSTFYRAIASGQSVSASFTEAKNALNIRDLPDNQPVLTVRSGLDANQLRFVSPDESQPQTTTAVLQGAAQSVGQGLRDEADRPASGPGRDRGQREA